MIRKKDTGYEIRFKGLTKRESIYLPRCSKRAAEAILRHCETISEHKRNGIPIPAESLAWGNSVDGKLRNKLSSRGIIEARAEAESSSRQTDLAGMIREYLGKQERLIKQQTMIRLRAALETASRIWGGQRDIRSIDSADVIALQANLKRRDLAPATINKQLSRVRQLFVYARKEGLITETPFADAEGVDCNPIANPDRMFYVEPEVALDIIRRCPDADLQMMVICTRFLGLRRHEVGLLRWERIDFENGTVDVRSNKTPAQRTTPLFAEARPLLIKRRKERGKVSRFDPDSNAPATLLRKWMVKNGITPWEKLYQNCRSSICTDMARRNYTQKTTCQWFGHSIATSEKYYQQVLDRDGRHAAGLE